MRLFITIVLCMLNISVFAQYQLQGVVTNHEGIAIQNSHIDLNTVCVDTDVNGVFTYNGLKAGKYLLKVSAEGYGLYQTEINLTKSIKLDVVLTEEETLETVVIHTAQQKAFNQQRVTQKYLQDNYSNSLANTLANVVGLDAVTIGAQTAKPMMRGLGFTRLAVTENGIKQEGQQWGADHGLEMDALTTESVEVIKGVGTIMYGSDAIAGVIEVNNELIPALGFTGQYITTAQTVNKSWVNALNLAYRNDRNFFKFKTSYNTFADYKVPVDEVTYLGTKIPLYNGTMVNTAGNEFSIYGQWGYIGDQFQSVLSVSQFANKSGFFAAAHGIPSVEDAMPDGNDRTVGMPYQSVNHTKLTYHLKWMNTHDIWDFKFGYQRNHRQEHSFFHSHYANEKAPELNPTVELDFVLNTLNADLSYTKDWESNHKSVFGIQNQYQNNQIGGYSYLMPAYDRLNVGIFTKHNWFATSKLNIELGARYDFGKLNVAGFFDDTLHEYLLNQGFSEDEALKNAQRSNALSKKYNQSSIALGLIYQITDKWETTFTASSTFRFPTAIELSSNGIHHGAFRHEQGNANLNTEKGWAFDLSQHFHTKQFKLNSSLYMYYFTNYIFLKPTGIFSVLPHGGQIYQYNQSKAILAGLELDATYVWQKFETQLQFAYLYNQQIREDNLNYPLPFSTPTNAQFDVKYAVFENDFFLKNQIQIGVKSAFQQNRIAQNEQITPGYNIVNFQYKTILNLNKIKPEVRFQINNLFNMVYYHHNSFYRALNIPEFGRNIQLFITIPLN